MIRSSYEEVRGSDVFLHSVRLISARMPYHRYPILIPVAPMPINLCIPIETSIQLDCYTTTAETRVLNLLHNYTRIEH